MKNVTERNMYESAYFVSQIQEQNILVKDIQDKINRLFCRGGLLCYTDNDNLGTNPELEKQLREAQKLLDTAMIRINDAVKYYIKGQK